MTVRTGTDAAGGIPDVVAERVATDDTLPPGRPGRRGMVAALVYCGLCTSVVGSLGALLIPTVAEDHGLPWSTAHWVLTASLLSGTVATPVLGALSDGPRRRAVLIGTLMLVLLGSLLAATATSFPQLVAGRALQGLAYGVVPMATATARAHLRPERSQSAVAALSISTVTGVGLSFPLTGLIVQLWDYHVAFWAAAGLTLVALIAVLATVPGPGPGGRRATHHLDWPGALLLAGALTCLLLAISEGPRSGWISATVLALLAGAAVLFPAWVVLELRTPRPLMNLRSFARRDVVVANVSALGLGAVLFGGHAAVSQLLQTPTSTGYGFALPLFAAGLALLPTSIGSQAAGWLTPRLVRRLGAPLLLVLAPMLIGLNAAVLALVHDQLWLILLGILVQGVATGACFILLPVLILGSVPAGETGSAVALNQVLRTLGGALGSAVIGAVLAAGTLPGERLPTDFGYTLAFMTTAGGCGLLVAFLAGALLLRGRRRQPVAMPVLEYR